MHKSCEAKVKKQKETHSEIERKRRERMKRETEFLSTQLMDKAVRKDKLSIYKAGADQLLKYTEKLGKREFILNDSEYSAIIVNNFNGISLHISCGDGEILWCHDNIKRVLGIDENEVIGNTLYNICESDSDTIKIIDDCLCIDSQEESQLRNGELISRNIFVTMKVSDEVSKNNCYQGQDGNWYTFVELCGDISFNTDQSSEYNRNSFDFKCLGRVLETAGPDYIEELSFVVKLVPDNFCITSICGDDAVLELFGVSPSDMLGENICGYIVEEERQYFKNSFNECISKQSLNLLINLKLYDNTKMQFSLCLNAVVVNKKVRFVAAKFVQYGPKMEMFEDKSWLKNVLPEKEHMIVGAKEEPELRTRFDIEEDDLSTDPHITYPSEGDSHPLSDCENLPSNDSFKSLIGDCHDLFYTDSIQDLVSEDINDIKCDDIIQDF